MDVERRDGLQLLRVVGRSGRAVQLVWAEFGAADLGWPPDSHQAIDIFIEAVQRSGKPEDCQEHKWVLEILVRRLRERRPGTPTEEAPELEEFAMRVQGTRSEVEEEVDPYIGYCEFCDEANRG